MSERRQLTLLVAGLVVLALVGFGGAALFPDACQQFQRDGTLELAYEDASTALGLPAADGARLQELGDEAGVGPWRGAVRLPEDADLLPSGSGFFVATSTDLLVLRPGLGGIVSNPRDVTGDAVLPAHGAFAVQGPDGTVALFDGAFEQVRCGALPLDAPPRLLDLDRGLAVLSDGDEVVARTLDGEELWRRGVDPAWAWVVEREVVLGGEDGTASVVVVGTDEVVAELPDVPTTVVDARREQVLLAGDDGPVLLDVGERTLRQVAGPDAVTGPGASIGIVPDGVVGARTSGDVLELGRTGSDGAGTPLPGVVLERLVTSDDGVVGVVLRNGELRALLQWASR